MENPEPAPPAAPTAGKTGKNAVPSHPGRGLCRPVAVQKWRETAAQKRARSLCRGKFPRAGGICRRSGCGRLPVENPEAAPSCGKAVFFRFLPARPPAFHRPAFPQIPQSAKAAYPRALGRFSTPARHFSTYFPTPVENLRTSPVWKGKMRRKQRNHQRENEILRPLTDPFLETFPVRKKRRFKVFDQTLFQTGPCPDETKV